jgi:steroid 5-alpha reductase family enzyme
MPVLIEFSILLALSLLISAVGFYRFLYFITIGYTFSIVGQSLAALFIFRQSLSALTVGQNILLIIYGLRLGIYLVQRESRQSYRREMDEINGLNAGFTLGRKIAIWLIVAFLYVLMFSPALFNLDVERAKGVIANPFIHSIGLLIMMLGMGTEALADRQKSAFKDQSPNKFCDVGLYRLVRCPNYLGEILFWIGNWTTAVAAYHGWLDWAIATTGLLGIAFVMLVSTMQLEQKQNQRYGTLESYQDYAKKVPILLPWLPLYSLDRIGKIWRWRV